MSMSDRCAWIDRDDALPLSRQCELAGVNRSKMYRASAPRANQAEELELCRLIDEEYTRRPFYGSRRMKVFLREQGYIVCRKRVCRLMRSMG